MGSYLINFSVYTMAMVGLIFFALFVFKKFSSFAPAGRKNGVLKVEEAMNLSARKTLYVVSAGSEKFLIASDIDKTTLISKLSADDTPKKSAAETKITSELPRKSKDDLSEVLDFRSTEKSPVLRELVKKLRA